MRTSHPSPTCPYCAATMRVSTMECGACGVEVRAAFRQTKFQMLTGEEQEFLEQYLLSDFSIKDMAVRTGMGYAAIRTRLDNLIAHYRSLRSFEVEKKRLLDQVAERKLTAAEAARRIAELDRGK